MIKFKLPTEVLNQLATDLGPVIPSLATSDAIKGMYVHFDKDVITAAGYNGAVAVRLQRELDKDLDIEPFDVVLSHPKLISLLKKLSGLQTTIKYDPERETVDLLSGGSKYRLHTISSKEYPNTKEMVFLTKSVANVHAEEITRAYHATVGFVSKQETRPILQGVNHKLIGDALTLTATDSHILRTTSLVLDPNVDNLHLDESHTLPALFITQVHRLLNKREECSIRLRTSDRAVAYEWHVDETRTSYTVYGRIIDGGYPDTSRLAMIADGYKKVQLSKQTVLELLGRIQATSDAADHVTIAFNGSKAKMLTKGEFPTVENFSLETKYEGEEPFVATVNTAFLQTAFKSFAEDAIGVYVLHQERPIFFDSVEDRTEGLALVLPIRETNRSKIEWGPEDADDTDALDAVVDEAPAEPVVEEQPVAEAAPVVTPEIGEAHSELDTVFWDNAPDEGVDEDLDDSVTEIARFDANTDEEFIERMEMILDMRDAWLPDFGTEFYEEAILAMNKAISVVQAYKEGVA